MFDYKPDAVVLDLMKKSGSINKAEALAAQSELTTALTTPLREGLLYVSTIGGVYTPDKVEPGSSTEFPLDLIAPGEEDNFVAYTNPGHGRIPERAVQSDYVSVPTYTITNSIDMLLRYAREAKWGVMARAMSVLRAGFVKKMNDDGWKTVVGAGVDRNILVYDADAAIGQLTKRVISNMKTAMKRQSGGINTGAGRLTDVWMSPEALEEIRNWGVDQLDDTSRREVYTATDEASAITRLFGINLHSLFELGASNQYQNFYTGTLSGTFPGSDTELLIGLDLSGNDSFYMPVKQELSVFEDSELHRKQRMGWYAWAELGFAVLDTRRVILGSC
jgi:hypothetical protein